MSSVLQQTLRGLCFDTGWCYAVFWKLKQRPRTVLTWEDAFYGRKMEVVEANSLANAMPGSGEQICGGLADIEDPIGLSVAKMSYHVYSVGEGIIGRVAFTNKHQWVFSPNDKGTAADGMLNRKANARMVPEKYPSGWEQQFAAGIKTIAVISVPQGVVQLGSTCVIVEDMKLVGHAKALFGTLQNVPGAFLSDFVSEVQKGRSPVVYPVAVPAPHLPPRDPVLMNVQSPSLAKTPPLPVNLGFTMAGGGAFNTNLGYSGVGRLPMMLALQQIHAQPHSWPVPSVPGFKENISHSSHPLLNKPGLESLPQASFPFFKPSIGAPGGVKASPPPRTGITMHLSPSSKARSIALPVSKAPLSQAGHSFFSADAARNDSVPRSELPDYLTTHGQSGPVSTTKNLGPVDGNQVASELSDIAPSMGSWKAVVGTTKENLFGADVTSGLRNTQNFGCESSVKVRQLVGARSEAEPLCSEVLGKSPSVGLERMPAESLLCNAERSLLPVDRPSLQSFRYIDKHKNPYLQSGQYGGTNFATENIHCVSERSSVESSQPQENVLPISMFASRRGLSTHLDRSTLSTIQQEPCTSEFFSMRAATSALQREQSMETFGTDNSQMSDLLQLAKEFDSADKYVCDKVDLHQCTSSLLCDDYIEDLQFSRPVIQNLELTALDSGAADNSVETLFTNELDKFDEFCAWLTKADTSKSKAFPQPVLFASTTDNDGLSAMLSTHGDCGITKGKEVEPFSGLAEISCQFATTQAECEPTLNADVPNSNCFAKEVTFSCKPLSSIQSEPQCDRFVNSRIDRKVSFPCFRSTDGDTELGCQEMAALPPAKRPHKSLKKGKQRSRPGRHDNDQSKGRQQMQDRIRELRAVVPDGASCSIDILLDKVVEYTDILHSMLQVSRKDTQNSTLQSLDQGNDVGACFNSTSLNASWAMDFGTQGAFCPIVVENLSQPGQMLVEMLCEEQEILKVVHTVRKIGLTILKGGMEARNNQVWARFVTEGPQDVHRVQVLWSLMQLLGSKALR